MKLVCNLDATKEFKYWGKIYIYIYMAVIGIIYIGFVGLFFVCHIFISLKQ